MQPKEVAVTCGTSAFVDHSGVSVNDDTVDFISDLWAMYPLMVTAEPGGNPFAKYDQL